MIWLKINFWWNQMSWVVVSAICWQVMKSFFFFGEKNVVDDNKETADCDQLLIRWAIAD